MAYPAMNINFWRENGNWLQVPITTQRILKETLLAIGFAYCPSDLLEVSDKLETSRQPTSCFSRILTIASNRSVVLMRAKQQGFSLLDICNDSDLNAEPILIIDGYSSTFGAVHRLDSEARANMISCTMLSVL